MIRDWSIYCGGRGLSDGGRSCHMMLGSGEGALVISENL